MDWSQVIALLGGIVGITTITVKALLTYGQKMLDTAQAGAKDERQAAIGAQQALVANLEQQLVFGREERTNDRKAFEAMTTNIGEHTQALKALQSALLGACKFKAPKKGKAK